MPVSRKLKQQRRPRLGKRPQKSEIVLHQTLSRLFHLVQFIKCWQSLLKLKFLKDSGEVQERRKKVVVFTFSTKREIGFGIFAS